MYTKNILLLISFYGSTLISMELQTISTQNISYDIENIIHTLDNVDIQQKIGLTILNNKKWWFLSQTLPHKSSINAIQFNPNIQYANCLAITNNSKVYLFNTATQQKIISFTHKNNVNSLRFSPSGNFLATTSDDGYARIFNIALCRKANYAKHIKPIIFYHNNAIKSICFSHNEKYLITGDKNGNNCYIFDINARKKEMTLCTTHNITTCCINAKNEIFIGTMSDKILIYSMHSPNTSKEFSCLNWTFAIDFDNSKNLLLTGSDDWYVRIFNMNTEKIDTLPTHESSIRSICCAISKNILATGTIFGKIRIFDINTMQEIASFSPHTKNDFFNTSSNICSLSFNCTGNLLATSSPNGNVHIFEQYNEWTLEQLWLKTIFNTWLLIEKPNKKIKTLKLLLNDIAQKNEFKLTKQKLRSVWLTFSKKMQDAILNNILYKIKLYGKEIKK